METDHSAASIRAVGSGWQDTRGEQMIGCVQEVPAGLEVTRVKNFLPTQNQLQGGI